MHGRLSLEDEATVGLDGDLGAALLVELEGGEGRLAFLGVDVILEGLTSGEHRKVEG